MQEQNYQRQIPKLLAILGATASGKSQTAMFLAQEIGAEIFNLDSICVYKYINILSAKPTLKDQHLVPHHAIDILEPYEHSHAGIFLELLNAAIQSCKQPYLIISGGSSFYLKSILTGLSPSPDPNPEVRDYLEKGVKNLDFLTSSYEKILRIDPSYMKKISPKDKYRILKALEIYLTTQKPPSVYFQENPPKKFNYPISLYCLDIPKDELKNNIVHRTRGMLKNGGIEEIEELLKLFPQNCKAFQSIGPKECIQYLRGELNKQECMQRIIMHTSQLAKKQNTFNKTQFISMLHLSKRDLIPTIIKDLKNHNSSNNLIMKS